MSRQALLIIPTYLRRKEHIEVLAKCVKTLRDSTDEELLLVDDGSPMSQADKDSVFNSIVESVDGTNMRIHYKEENTGFSSTVNVGLKRALDEGKDACLINSDIEFIEYGWLNAMKETDADIVGALLLYPNYVIQHAGIYFSTISRAFDHRFAGCPPNLPAALEHCACPVTGALQYIRNEVLADVGLYDENFKLGMEDVDFMIRAISAGWSSMYNPKVKAIHHESLIRGEKTEQVSKWEMESWQYLLNKWENVNFKGIAPTMMEKRNAISSWA